MKITYVYGHGDKEREETFDTDFSEAFVEWNCKKIYKKDYPNIFEALSGPYPTSHHFDFRVVPIQGVKLINNKTNGKNI